MSNTLNLGTDGNWGVKKDSLLAYNSENGNYKPLPFDFTRDTVATVVNKDGLIETVGSGEPRIDFSNDTKGALLLEPSRSNSLLQSNSLDQWSKSTSMEVTGSQVGVGGSDNAWLINRTDTGARYVQASSTVSGTQVLSFYAKANTTDWIWVFNGTDSCYLDISNGVQGTSVGFTDVTFELMDNSWYRVSLKADNSTTYTRIYPANANGSVTGLLVDLSFYIQYAQLESGSYATSYIPTSGSAVTRSADVCNNGGNEQVINSTEGVLYAEISALSDDSTNRYISLSDGSTSNRVNIFFDSNNKLRGFYNGLSGSITISTNITLTNKIAFKYKSGDSSFWLNGFEVATRTDALSLSGLDSLSFDLGGGSDFYGNVKDVRVYNTALTDSELQALTK